MKTHMKVLAGAAFGLALASAQAQMGGGGMMGGPRGAMFTPIMARLFEANPLFTAAMENEIQLAQNDNNGPTSGTMSVPGKLSYDSGKSRFEMDVTQMRGIKLPPEALAQMKTMGMDKVVFISRPDKKASYMIYPGLEAYVETPIQESDSERPDPAVKSEVAEVGKETVDGHACVKNKATITDSKGEKHEFTVWNASDLKTFPVKLETRERGAAVVMHFREVKLSKPDAGVFDPPAAFKRYDNMAQLMQEQMMKHMGPPPGGPQ